MKNKKKRVREIADYIKFVFPMLVLYILFFYFSAVSDNWLLFYRLQWNKSKKRIYGSD